MADKIKPLKLETTADGTQLDPFPIEANPVEDLVAAKGIAFENTDTQQIYSSGGELYFRDTIVATPVTLQELLDIGNSPTDFDLILTSADYDVLVSDDGNVLTL